MPWFGEQVSVAIEGGGLRPLLELEVLHPEPDSVLEARVPLARGDLLFGFDFGDHPGHLSIRAALVEEAVANATTSLPPVAVRVRHEPGPAEPSLSLVSHRVAPLRFVEGHASMCPDDEGAALLAIDLHLEPPLPGNLFLGSVR